MPPARKRCRSRSPAPVPSCRTRDSSRSRRIWPSPQRSTPSSRATGNTARAWPTSARSISSACRRCTTSPPARRRTTPGATASPPCRPPTGRRITSISTPPIRRRTPSARRPSPTIFFFDKDRGAEIFVRACGGNYLALENGKPTGFNPFHCERNETNVQFLADLVKVMAGKSVYSSREEEDIFRAVENMLDTPMHLRTLSNFQKSLPNMGDDGLFIRMRKWTAGNSLGWVFDNPVDTIDLEKANIIGFDYTELIDNPEARVPVINYLLHRLEALIDGRPLIYVMDEFWKILDGKGGLKEFAKNKQKTIRKQNGLGIFATQSPEDALASDIAAALIEQTATMILLPNPNASREDYVEGLKLTEAEYQVVVSLDER